ncbi:MAG: methyltransferase domain-containing protein [Oscillatoriales cyanobacterium SM2_2_1]|nr:methyltransferase domain-containing protein [Oscillatoriales cyanobacterium SM2_2_1]
MLRDRIAAFYDQTTALWEQVWGEHLHHGYYEPHELAVQKDRRQAQIDLMLQLLRWGNVRERRPQRILDLGCGVGGSALFLANYLQAEVVGVTLSPYQAARATIRARELGLSERVTVQVADAMDLPWGDRQFDLVWALESAEHMPDKAKFLGECQRVLRPGGQVLIATWCHRSVQDRPLTTREQELLHRIYEIYCLPYVIALNDYGALAQVQNWQNIELGDWTTPVAPFWDAVITSALPPNVLWQIGRSGLTMVRAALAARLMARGYAQGSLRFGVMQAQAPSNDF